MLPFRSVELSNSVSRWFLGVWFAMGVTFSFVAIVGVTMVLLWESSGAFHLYTGTFRRSNHLGWLFGISPLVHSFSISILDTVIMVFSTLLSVAIHKFGHAIADASEGIQFEYIAIFLVLLFPGALVAFRQ